MSQLQLALSRSGWVRPPVRRRRKYLWREAKESRLTLPPVEATENESQWPAMEEQCAAAAANISQGYREAIALLRSLRGVDDEEAQEQRKTWELLEQALDEDKYH